MMQALGRRYVRYFNFEYQRSGTLWEGRYKSCLVQEERYLLEVPLEPLERRKNYHALFVHRVDGELLEEIRANTNKGLAVGA